MESPLPQGSTWQIVHNLNLVVLRLLLLVNLRVQLRQIAQHRIQPLGGLGILKGWQRGE